MPLNLIDFDARGGTQRGCRHLRGLLQSALRVPWREWERATVPMDFVVLVCWLLEVKLMQMTTWIILDLLGGSVLKCCAIQALSTCLDVSSFYEPKEHARRQFVWR